MKTRLLLGVTCALLCAAAVTEDKLRSAQADSGSWLTPTPITEPQLLAPETR